jgi:NHL repeat-containing protein
MSSGEKLRGSLKVAGLIAAGLLLVLAAPASAQSDLCGPGSGAGQCENPRGVAVDFETGRFFVADQGNNRVDVFEGDGSFVGAFGWGVADGVTNALQSCDVTCFKGIAGTGAGQFSSPARIAVDNDPLSPAHHDVYVGSDGFRVQRFGPDGSFKLAFGWGVRDGAAEAQTCGPSATPASATCQTGIGGTGPGQIDNGATQDLLAVGPGGIVYVADSAFVETDCSGGSCIDIYASRIEKFQASGAFNGEVPLAEPQSIKAEAIDETGNIYLALSSSGGVLKYGPGGEELNHFDSDLETHALSFDEAGQLLAAQRVEPDKGGGSFQVVTIYTPTGEHIRRFGYGEVRFKAAGLAAKDPIGAGVAVSEEGAFGTGVGAGVRLFHPPPPGPIAAPSSVGALFIANTKAKLGAEINPEGAPSTYRFEYVDRQSFEDQGGFVGAATKGVEGDVGAEDSELHAVEALIGCPDPTEEPTPPNCLTPETEYLFRLMVENADGQGNTPVEDSSFKFTTEPAVKIVKTFASEVGTDVARLGAVVNSLGIPTTGYFEYVSDAAYEEDVEAGGDGFAAAARAPDVASGKAPLDFGSGEKEISRTVVTSPLIPGTTYHYRLLALDPLLSTPIAGEEKVFRTFVSPTVGLCPQNEAFRSGSSSLLPDCRAYEMVSPLDKANGDIVTLAETLTGAPSVLNQSSTSGEKLAYGSYRAYGDTRSAPYTAQFVAVREPDQGWISQGISPPRARSLLLPALQTDTEIKLLSPDLCQVWLGTFAEPPLTEAAVAGFSNLYRQSLCPRGGYEGLSPVPPQNASPEEFGKGLELQGVSADGTHMVYVARDNLATGATPQPAVCVEKGELCEARLYEQVRGEAEPRLVCVLPGGSPSAGPCSAGTSRRESKYRRASVANAISADGERIFWTAANGEGKIYVRIGGIETRAVSQGAEEAAGSTGSWFWGAADDGSKAIFTTPTGAGDDLYEFDVDSEAHHLVAGRVAGVVGASEDARRIYFVSREALAAEATEGEPNLYLYDSDGLGSGIRFVATVSSADANRTPVIAKGSFSAVAEEPMLRAARVSSDGLHAVFVAHTTPTGYDNTDEGSQTECGQPGGVCDGEVFLYDAGANGGAGKLICASCNPGGGRPAGGSQVPVFGSDLYGSRALSADGSRLYFESDDQLVTRDTNGRRDVYQWEAEGKGSCDDGDSTFVSDSSGCVELISSGQSNRDSEFVDASPTGEDVFFATLSGLVPQDYGLVDIYDARVNGGLPSPSEPPAPCEGEACQNPPAAPAQRTPSSSIFKGPANPTPEGRQKAHCKKAKRSAAASKGSCRKKKSKHRKNHSRSAQR